MLRLFPPGDANIFDLTVTINTQTFSVGSKAFSSQFSSQAFELLSEADWVSYLLLASPFTDAHVDFMHDGIDDIWSDPHIDAELAADVRRALRDIASLVALPHTLSNSADAADESLFDSSVATALEQAARPLAHKLCSLRRVFVCTFYEMHIEFLNWLNDIDCFLDVVYSA